MRDLKKEYSQHLQAKTNTMLSLWGELDCACPCPPIVPSPVESGYRNRAKFKIFGKGKQAITKGTDPVRGEVPYEESLWILPEWGRDIVRAVDSYLRGNSLGEGIDGFEVKLTHGRTEAYITLSVKRDSVGEENELAQGLLEKIDGLAGLVIPSKKKEYGDRFLHHHILDEDIFAHPSAFFQSNIFLTPVLIDHVRSLCAGDLFSRLYDLYCGTGLFSVFLRGNAEELLGVDTSRKAIESAWKNSGNIGLVKAQFICARMENYFVNLDIGSADLLLFNPPRSGVPSALIEAAAAKGTETVCIISCSLETHVQDLRCWIGGGYQVESIAAFDMFPFTDFLETVTLLKRTN